MTAVFAEEFFVDCYTPVKYIFIYINKENINTLFIFYNIF